MRRKVLGRADELSSIIRDLVTQLFLKVFFLFLFYFKDQLTITLYNNLREKARVIFV